MQTVSVIICCYNGSKFIDQCFSCLLNQTYKNIEAVFIDDGSTDQSYAIATSYIEKFSEAGMKLICLAQENKGAGGAAALGLTVATGKYICCYDIDDILYPTSLEQQVLFLEQNPSYDIVRTNGYRVSQNINKSLFINNEEEKNKTDIFEDLLLEKTNNWAGSYMVTSKALWNVYKDHKIIESRYGQNLQILLAVAYNNKSGFIDIPLMEYKYNPQSFTNQNKTLDNQLKNLQGFYELRKNVLDKLNLKNPTLRRKLDITYLYLYLDLALHFNNEKLFIQYYKELSKIESPKYLYKYHFFKRKRNIVLSTYYRMLNYISNHLYN